MAQAVDAADFAAARALILEYAASLGIDLEFQGFEAEVAGLPGPYAPPAGALYLARWGADDVGCVALRAWGERVAELKRLYVRPAWQGRGIGRRLADAAVAAARERGYGAVRLDTLAHMVSAQELYRSLGFAEIAAYRHNPVAGTVFMELSLYSVPV